MWERIRYSLCLYGYPPHDAVTLLPRFIELVHQAAGQSLVWWSAPNRPVPTSPEGWAALIAEKRDPEDGAIDQTLASPSGLSMLLSADWPPVARDFDVLCFEMAPEHLTGPQAMFDFDSLFTLFTESVRLFRPFSARVNDRELTRTEIGDIYLSVDTTRVPATIYWFNYFAQDMVERLGGMEKLLAAPAYRVTPVEEPPGVILILQRELFDYHHPEHRRRHEEITQYLDLSRLHTLYPKQRKQQGG